MIRIEVSENKLTVTGHACAGPPGQDIVCSAISVLLQTFEAAVEVFTIDHLKSDIKAGDAVIEHGDLSEEAKLLKKSFLLGATQVAIAYPECVKVVDQEGGKHE